MSVGPAGASVGAASNTPTNTPTATLVPTTAADWRALGWLMLAALLVLGAGIGLRDPWPSDEPRFVLVARHMVESGDWWFPRRGSELYSDKPPMLMWLQALAWQVTGHWRVAFLLPSLLAGLATLALVWDLGRRLWSPQVGLLSAVAVLSAFMFSFQFKRAQIDPVVTCLITLANWGLLRHLLLGPNWRAFWFGCFAAGLGVITKGVGLLALLMLLPYVLVRRAGWQGLVQTRGSAWRWAVGALAFVVAIALWLVPVVVLAWSRGTPEYAAYLQDILFNQTARRYAGQVGGHEGKPLWYFAPVLLLHFFPLSLAYVAGWHDARAGWRARDGRLAVLLGWCALVLVFFTLADGKREVYVLPMLPMLALALGPTLVRIAPARWLHLSALTAALLLGGGLLAAGGWGAAGQWSRMDAVMAERGLLPVWPAAAGLLAAAGAGFWLASAWVLASRRRAGAQALLAGLAGLWLVWGLGIAPLANGAASAADVMRQADAVAGPGGELAFVAWKEQNLLMALRPVRDFGFKQPPAAQLRDAQTWLQQAPDKRWVFADAAAVAPCVDAARVVRAGRSNRRDWWMFQADAVLPGCTLPADHGQVGDGVDD